MIEPGFESVLPATVTILVAVITHRVATALFAGIAVASFMIAQYIPSVGFATLWKYILISFSDLERIQISLFLFFVGATLSVITASGGYIAFSTWLTKYLTTPRKTRITTFALSLMMFIDDYANVLICGASMRSMIKVQKISPALLSYIVDRTATIASVVLVSTWAAFEASLMKSSGYAVQQIQSATEFFLQSLPYHASTYLGILLVAMAVWQGKWLGAHFDTGNTLEPINAEIDVKIKLGKLRHLFAPMLTLIGAAFGSILVYTVIGIKTATGPYSIMKILGNIPTVKILLCSSGLAWITSIISTLSNKQITFKDILKSSWAGIITMVSPAMVIILANGLAQVSEEIGIGTYLSIKMSSFVVPQIIPSLIFILSLLITVATGFSWSSMAIVMPIAYKLAIANNSPELIPILSGAVVSGAISGALMAPYSDKTVLTAAAFGISPLYHARTQLIQSLLSSIGAIIFFLILGYKSNYLLAAICSIALLVIIQFMFAKEHYEEPVIKAE